MTTQAAGKDDPRNDPARLLERTRACGESGPMLQAHADAIQKCGALPYRPPCRPPCRYQASASGGVMTPNEAGW
jgi:hypothetical protein